MDNTIVSAEWLKTQLNDHQLILLDVSPQTNASSLKAKYPGVIIPSARCLNIKKEFRDQAAPFPNTMMGSADFENAARKLGVNNNSKIVVYDNLGIYTSPRVWWMFKAMGHENIVVLDGGLNTWIDQGFGTSSKETSYQIEYPSGNFKAKLNKELLISYDQVLQNIKDADFTIVDARSESRFNGIAPEPRAELKSGHISGSINIPYKSLLSDGRYKSIEELKAIFENSQTDNQELVFSCGSGITACIVMLANEIAFGKSRRLYDGSWTEWATLQNLTTI